MTTQHEEGLRQTIDAYITIIHRYHSFMLALEPKLDRWCTRDEPHPMRDEMKRLIQIGKGIVR
jgi:hypothetical protein